MGQKLEGITTLIWEYVCELKKSILGTVVYYNKAKEQELFQFLIGAVPKTREVCSINDFA